jgi:hypothetical protein
MATSGHSVIMGRRKHAWQARDYVLRWFGKTAARARQAYRAYLTEGELQGKRPELVGGGLVRSQGGWAEVITMRRRGEREIADERILGNGAFVEKILQGAEQQIRKQYSMRDRKRLIDKTIAQIVKRHGIDIEELRAGSRRAHVDQARSEIVMQLVRQHGISLASIARHTYPHRLFPRS